MEDHPQSSNSTNKCHSNDLQSTTVLGESQHEQVTNSILQLGATPSSSTAFEIQEYPQTYFEGGAVVLDSGISPFFDNLESGQMIFKGILDQNGALVLDPAQFAALIGSVQMDNGGHSVSSSHQPRGIWPSTTAGITTSQSQNCVLPLTPLNQNNNKGSNKASLPSSSEGGNQAFNRTTSTELYNKETASTTNKPIAVGSTRVIGENTTLSTSMPKLILSTVVSGDTNKSSVSNLGANNDSAKIQNPSCGSSQNLNSTEIENQQPDPVPDFLHDPPLGKGPYRCTDCEKVFLKWPQFKRHKSEHLDIKKFQCPLCSMSFNHEVNLKLHEMIHEAELSGCLECKLCPAKFSRLASLKSHIRVHEKEENLVCVECGDEFATKARLDTHLEEHKTTKSLVHRCRLCGRTFTHAALLKDHSKEHSAVRNQLKLISTRRKRPTQKAAVTDPSVAGDSSSDPAVSTKSSRKESKKKLMCAICAKRFEKPSQLNRHVRIHTGEKPYACNQCGRSFNQKNTLDSHILSMHEKLKPHTCHLCNCQFSQRGNLRAHVLKVHINPGDGEQCFKCEECSCIFKKLASLNTHISKVHSKTKSAAEPSITNTNDSNLLFIGLPPILPSTMMLTTVHETQPEPVYSSDQVLLSSTTPCNAIAAPPASTSQTFTEVTILHKDDSGQKTAFTVKIKRVGQVKFHLCPYNCNTSFKKPSDLIRHIRTHTLEKPYSCPICKKSFSVKSTMKIHMKLHSGQKDWECQVCHKQFTVLTSLRAHERLHTGLKPFPCMQCGKCFRTSSQRRVHMKAHSRNDQGLTGKRRLLRIGDTEPRVDLSDPLKITSDGLVPVPNRAVLSLVSQTSDQQDPKGGGRPYRCGMCTAGFKKSSHLKQHERSHTNERPYKCFQCLRSFISSGVLKNHIKTHEGVRAFKCKQCQLAFTTNGSLTRHMVSHTDERSFVCPYCMKSFKTSVACRKHIKTHRSEFVALSESDPNATDQVGVQQQPQNNENLESQEEDAYESVINFPSAGMPNNTMQVQQHLAPTLSENCPGTSTNEIQQHLEQRDNLNPESRPTAERTSIFRFEGDKIPQALHYSTVSSDNTAMDEVVNQISLSHAFENSIFTLHGSTDNLELPVSLSSLIPTSMLKSAVQSIPPIHSRIYTTQSAHFVPVSTPTSNSNANPTHSSILMEFESENHVPSEVAHTQTVITSDDADINKIVESSLPISDQQIYSDIQTAASSEVEVNMTELLVTTFNDLAKGKVNICSQCGRGFKKRSDLIRHCRIHTGEKPFKCNSCGKSFRVKSTREAHMRTHEGGKTIACHVCNNLFSTKSSLRVHLRLHTGARPYKCEHCDRNFRTSGHRKAHIASHFKTPKVTKTQHVTSQMGVSRSSVRRNFVQNGSEIDPAITQDQHQPQPTIYTTNSLEQINVHHNNSLTIHQDPGVQIIGSLQMSLDGSQQVQNIQLGNIDLSSLQISEELLQSLGNVIFVTPHTNQNQIITTGDLSSVNLLGSGVSVQTEEGGGVGDGESQQHHTIPDVVLHHRPSSSLSVQNQNQLPSIVSVSDLDTLLPTGRNLMGFTSFESPTNVLNNNSPMLSSTSTFTGATNPTDGNVNMNPNIKETTTPIQTTSSVSNNKQCPTCGRIFARPSLLNRHMTAHTGLKPFKCDICSCTFNRKNSLEVHKYTHGTERPFSCTICPFKTVGKAALKTHLSRAHPGANIEDMLTPK